MKRFIALLFLFAAAMQSHAASAVVTNFPFTTSLTTTDYFYMVHWSNGVQVSRNVALPDMASNSFPWTLPIVTNSVNDISFPWGKDRTPANSFVFVGTSLEKQSVGSNGINPTAVSSGIGFAWPQLLLQQGNYATHGSSYNFGAGGSTFNDWVTNYWTNTVGTLPSDTTNRWMFIGAPVNDINSLTAGITNNWSNIVTWARASNYTIVVLTCATNVFLTDSTHTMVWSNMNAYIVSNSSMYDYIVRSDLLLTNTATQCQSDGLHYSPLFTAQLATFINTNIVPSRSGAWGKTRSLYESPAFANVRITNQLYLHRSLEIHGDKLAHVGDEGMVPEIYLDPGAGGTFTMLNYNWGTSAWGEVAIIGNDISLQPHGTGRVVVFGSQETTGSIYVDGTTNQVIFGGTNNPPVTTATPKVWISVQVSGQTNQWRIPLYQ